MMCEKVKICSRVVRGFLCEGKTHNRDATTITQPRFLKPTRSEWTSTHTHTNKQTHENESEREMGKFTMTTMLFIVFLLLLVTSPQLLVSSAPAPSDDALAQGAVHDVTVTDSNSAKFQCDFSVQQITTRDHYMYVMCDTGEKATVGLEGFASRSLSIMKLMKISVTTGGIWADMMPFYSNTPRGIFVRGTEAPYIAV